VQIAASFVLLAGAGALVRTLLTLQATNPGFQTRNVLAVDVPVMAFGKTNDQVQAFYRDVRRKVTELPGVDQVALANSVPWRDARSSGPAFSFSLAGRARENGEEDPRAKFRSVSPGYFATLGIPLLAGRDFTDADKIRRRARGDRQPEPRAAVLPESERGEREADVDRQRDEIHRRQSRATPDHRRRRGSRR
jgi:hypothetical protein